MTPPPNNQGPVPPPPPVGHVENGYQWNGQTWVPFTPAPEQAAASTSKPWFKKWWVWVLGVLVLGAIINGLGEDPVAETAAPVSQSAAPETTQEETAPAEDPTETATEATTEAASPSETPPAETTEEATTPEEAPAETTEAEPTSEADSEFGTYPESQAAFISGVEAAAEAYDAAETELQMSKVLRDRDKDLLATIGGSGVTEWVGVIDEVGANGEGKAHVTIEIGDDIKVKTWNNAFSDLMDETLIPESSPLFDALLTMKRGDKVTFSGEFVEGSDTPLSTTNITEVFSAISPEFLFRFSAIAPA